MKNFVRIDGWPVAPATARAYLTLKQDHDKNCPCGVPMRITSGYRTRSEQITEFTARYRQGAWSPFDDYRIFQGVRWGRVEDGGPVMSPDAVSNHTLGYALDLDVSPNGVCQQWMLEHAPAHGFNWEEGRANGESWHWCCWVTFRPTSSTPDPWEGRGAPDPVYPSDEGIPVAQIAAGKDITITGPALPPTVSEEEEDMALIEYINVQGKTGARRGGTFSIMRPSATGALVAQHVSDKFTPGVPTFDTERSIGELQSKIPGII